MMRDSRTPGQGGAEATERSEVFEESASRVTERREGKGEKEEKEEKETAQGHQTWTGNGPEEPSQKTAWTEISSDIDPKRRRPLWTMTTGAWDGTGPMGRGSPRAPTPPSPPLAPSTMVIQVMRVE
jgi:hypothetical protein